jgi:DNA (cytosine-5)-methyltransferase 1
VLDAQNFGVPQRRRRVFVVGHLGDWQPAAKVLFESESLSGDSKPSRKTRKGVAGFVESSFGQYREDVIAGTTKASGGVLGGGSETFLTVYENHPSDSRVKDMGDTCQTVTSTWGSGGGNIPFVQNISYALQGAGATSQTGNGMGYKEEQSYTLNTTDVHGVAFGWQNSSHQGMSIDTISPTLDKSKTPAVAVPYDLHQVTSPYNSQNRQNGDPCHTLARDSAAHASIVTNVVAPTLTASNDPSRSPQSSEVTNQISAVYAASTAVRRLTPVECERLQGFPDNYTQIPWNKKVSVDCPDGLRYKAMGNSMAVPVMNWIGTRINNLTD